MQVTLAELKIVTETGRPASVTMPIQDGETFFGGDEAPEAAIRIKRAAPDAGQKEVLKRGMEEKSKEFVRKGAEVYSQA